MGYVRGEPLLDSNELRFCKKLAKEYKCDEDVVIDLFKHNVDIYPNYDPFELTFEDLIHSIEKERRLI